jgi:hypothetical protein
VTDLVLHTLTVEGASAQPTGLVFPDGSGEVASLDDPEALTRWYRAVRDLEDEALKPAKALAAEALYQHMDSEGSWTLHFSGMSVTGESRAAWETATKVDAEALYEDLVTLRQREGQTAEAAEDWADDFFVIKMELKPAGKQRLQKMSAAYREALEEHTAPYERSRKAPSVKRS